VRERICVSVARARLSQILRELDEQPERVYEITVNGRVVGVLSATDRNRLRVKPGAQLLAALEAMGKPDTDVPVGTATARDHDRFLYMKEREGHLGPQR